MLTITCSGTPFELGQRHGSEARDLIQSSIAFYTAFFQETASISYQEACDIGKRFVPYLSRAHPDLLEEIKGVADGAKLPFEQILALNVRTEISYGMSTVRGLAGAGVADVPPNNLTDGCTAVSWHDEHSGLLAQNWDWVEDQRPNLIRLRIQRPQGVNGHSSGTANGSVNGTTKKKSVDIITEAGIIGKIGLNSAGVGVCLNAIRAPGVSYDRLPVHLALRTILDSADSVEDAIQILEKDGVSSSAHILVADGVKAVGLETSIKDIVQVGKSQVGNANLVLHTNHYIEEHRDVSDGGGFLVDSAPRLARIGTLAREPGKVNVDKVKSWLKDEDGFPASICRGVAPGNIVTLFSIVMDLNQKLGHVKMGRPVESGEELQLNPSQVL